MTIVDEIYDNFLRKISDYSFLTSKKTNDEIKDELSGFLRSAKARFRKCKQSLDIIFDENGIEVFVNELTDFEIEILTALMLVEYLKPKLLAGELMRPALSDKDFKIYSQANHLREINLLFRLFSQEARRMVTEYTYDSLGDDKK